jgi:hypothetical protein
MTTARARRLALAGMGVSALAYSAVLTLIATGAASFELLDTDLAFLAVFLFWGALGALLAAKVPANPIGWLFLVVSVLGQLAFFAQAYGTIQDAPGREYAAWFSSWMTDWTAPLLLILVLLLFPTGRFATVWDRRAAWCMALLSGLATTALALTPGELPYHPIDNPFGAESAGGSLEAIQAIASTGMAVIFVFAAGSLLRRLRRSSGVERQQYKWFFLPTAVFAVIIVTGVLLEPLTPDSSLVETVAAILTLLTLAGFPAAIAVAILRYRLYGIDALINRALVYGTLTATLGLAYAALVFGLPGLLGPITTDSDLAVAASTLIVAALFRPLRSRIQGFIDRRFYRRRYDSVRTLESLTKSLRDQVEMDAVTRDVLDAVRETVQPAHAGVWVKAR